MVEKNQVMRYNSEEIDAIKKAFNNNDDIVYSLRKFLWQQDLTELEWKDMKRTMTKDVIDVLRKEFIGGVEYEVPLMQTFDPFVFKEITSLAPDMVYLISEAKSRVVEYFAQQLDDLEFNNKGPVKLDDMLPSRKDDEDARYIKLYARATIISVTEKALDAFRTLGNAKSESEEQRKERKLKDSNK